MNVNGCWEWVDVEEVSVGQKCVSFEITVWRFQMCVGWKRIMLILEDKRVENMRRLIFLRLKIISVEIMGVTNVWRLTMWEGWNCGGLKRSCLLCQGFNLPGYIFSSETWLNVVDDVDMESKCTITMAVIYY